jgi:hypothetical protein
MSSGQGVPSNGWWKIVAIILPLIVAALVWGGAQAERHQQLQRQFDIHMAYAERRVEEFNQMKSREATMTEKLANIEIIVRRIEQKVEKYK